MDQRRLERKCWRKKGYRTSREAQKRVRETYKIEHLRLYKYLCADCGEWHLTKSLSAKGKVI